MMVWFKEHWAVICRVSNDYLDVPTLVQIVSTEVTVHLLKLGKANSFMFMRHSPSGFLICLENYKPINDK